MRPVGKFESPYPTAISQISEIGWELVDHVVWLGWTRDGEQFTVEAPVKKRTDLASVPLWLWALFPPYGRYTAAAIVHDELWDMAKRGEITFGDADYQLREMLRACGVSELRSGIMWASVRWAGMVGHPAAREDWRRDLPDMIRFSLKALPFVTLPIIVNVTHGWLFRRAERAWSRPSLPTA